VNAPLAYHRMALNNAWANATLYAALSGLGQRAFRAPRPGFFPSLKATLNHIHMVDLYYLDALEGGGLGRTVFDAAEIDDPNALGTAQAATDLRLARICKGLTDERLSETCITARADGPVEEKVGAVLLHLFQHQIHHRGQAHVQLQEAGIAPPQLDDFYLTYGRVPSAAAYWS